MVANELRIGNLIRQVDYVTGETICIRTVTSINKEGYLNVKSKGIENIKSQPLKSFEPIPLTEEILLKCGFVRIPNGYEFTNGKLTVLPCMYGKEFLLTLDMNCVHKGGQKVKYLHKLQNLYFALTGEELEVNL